MAGSMLKAVDWRKAGLLALAGAAAVGVSAITKKKTKSTPIAVAAGAVTVPLSIFVLWYGMELTGMTGLVMENVGALPSKSSEILRRMDSAYLPRRYAQVGDYAGLVMENVGAMPDMRTRSALGDYRGLVMENVSGLYDYV